MGLLSIEHLKSLTRKELSSDLIAGLTVAVMLIPQGMAYALLSGLPPIYGLYAALVPLLIYPFFGSSPYLSVGPVALVSILVFSGLSAFAEPMSQEFIELAILTALLAGTIQVLLAIFRMGFLVNFLSNPVIAGFTAASALIIAVSQMKYVLGITIPAGKGLIGTVKDLILNSPDANLYAVIIGLGGIAFIFILKRIKRSFPAALIAVVIGILITIASGWHENGLQIVGEVPAGLPAFSMPDITLENIQKVLPLSLIICLISFIESLAIAKTLGAKNDEFNISANKELLGLGLAKIAGSFFQAFPNTGSFTRSAINEQAGAKSGLSSITASIFIALTLLFFTTYFFYLPKAILAAIVIAAVFGLIDIKNAKHLFNKDRNDFYVLITTFVLTLLLGIQQGVFVGIILSVLIILYKVSKPHYAILGRLPGTNTFRNVKRFKEVEIESDKLILRYDDELFFGNADHFTTSVIDELDKHKAAKHVILDVSAISNIDSTGMTQFIFVLDQIKHRNIEVRLADPKGPIRDVFKTHGIYDYIGREFVHVNISNALKAIEAEEK